MKEVLEIKNTFQEHDEHSLKKGSLRPNRPPKKRGNYHLGYLGYSLKKDHQDLQDSLKKETTKFRLPIQETRKLLGKTWSPLSDQQLELLIFELSLIANLHIGNHLSSVDKTMPES